MGRRRSSVGRRDRTDRRKRSLDPIGRRVTPGGAARFAGNVIAKSCKPERPLTVKDLAKAAATRRCRLDIPAVVSCWRERSPAIVAATLATAIIAVGDSWRTALAVSIAACAVHAIRARFARQAALATLLGAAVVIAAGFG